jgi:hypothetical protein
MNYRREFYGTVRPMFWLIGLLTTILAVGFRDAADPAGRPKEDFLCALLEMWGP